MPTLEFGIAKNPLQALIRLPERSHPSYNNPSGGPIEHLVHTRERLFDIVDAWVDSDLSQIDLFNRWIPLSVDDMRLMFQAMSFRRNIKNPLMTCNWGYLYPNAVNPWTQILPSGDDKYRWWQVTKLDPEFRFSNGYELLCVEANSVHDLRPTSNRFNEAS